MWLGRTSTSASEPEPATVPIDASTATPLMWRMSTRASAAMTCSAA